MDLRTVNVPVAAAPRDDVWLLFRDFESLGAVYVESLTGAASVQIASGPDTDPANLGAATTLTFTQAGVIQRLLLPVGTNVTNRSTRVRVVTGRVSIGAVSPSAVSTFMSITPV